MIVEIAQIIVLLIGAYALIGVIFAIPFALIGSSRIDAAARDASWGFRALVIPGAAALWPWLLARWIRPGRGSA